MRDHDPPCGAGILSGKTGFIADLVAAGPLLARTDPVDEWLQVALALSIEILGRDPLLDPTAITEGPSVSTDRSGDHEAGAVVVQVLRIDGWMAISRWDRRRLWRRGG